MNDYKIAFYYSPEDELYIACVPELPGCMADGETIDDAMRNAQTVIAEWIQTAQEEGRVVPKPWTPVRLSKVSVLALAKYILEQTGKISTWALEKLAYYCKVWSLCWYGQAITDDAIGAWPNGPVYPRLFAAHRGRRLVAAADIQAEGKLSMDDRRLVDMVLSVYGDFDGDALKDMTHREDPWLQARQGLLPSQKTEELITDAMIRAYYQRDQHHQE